MSEVLHFTRNASGFVTGTKVGFSPGCRFITFASGAKFDFNESQSIIIECLLEHLIDLGITHVPSSVLLARLQLNRDAKVSENDDAIDIRSKLKDYFKHHPAWGTLIKNTGPGRGAKIYLDFSLSPSSLSVEKSSPEASKRGVIRELK